MKGLISFLTGKCPQCRNAYVFKYPIFNLLKCTQVKSNCSNCKVKYEPEPGFFWGAMYFSYALIVGISVILGLLIFYYLNDPSAEMYLIIIMGITIGISPLILRISRLLMMYIVAPYRKYKG